MALDTSYWKKNDAISKANFTGFNYLVEIPKLIRKAYPEFNEWEMGFCTEDALPTWFTRGWMLMESSDFPDVKDFNTAIGLRFGIQPTVDGKLKYKDNYLMKMPKFFREDQKKQYEEQTEANFAQLSGKATGKTPEGDMDIEYEETKIVQPAVKRGRPKST